MTSFDATLHNPLVCHVFYIGTNFLLLNTFWHEWARIKTICKELLYKVGFKMNTVYMTRFDAT
jgi:hypothetical protein